MAFPQRKPGIQEIKVPLSLLLSDELTPAAKLLWIRLRLDEAHPRKRSHRPRQLAKRTCLARSTVYEALRQAEAAGWLIRYVDPANGKRRWKTAVPSVRAADGPLAKGPVRMLQRPVRIPADLVRAAHALRPQAILCYGVLQATPGFNGRTGSFKWAQLRRLTGLHLRTLRRAVQALTEARWISIAQENRRAPIWFRLQHADRAYKEEVEARLERAGYLGETLMRSFLTLIADTKECEDGARPEFLVNPATGERLELDRYYPLHRVAFEFNGRQHYIATGPFSKQEVSAQRKRDRLKQKICKEKNVELVVIHAQDLTLRGMLKKVGALLPLRALRGFKETIRFLNRCGLRYQAVAGST